MNASYDSVFQQQRRIWVSSCWRMLVIVALIALSSWYTGLLDSKRVIEGIPSIAGLIKDSLPPDFRGARDWIKPLRDTMAMSVAGTALAIVISLPLSLLGARNTSPHPFVYAMARGVLNGLRSVPELIMGILFVAAVGFGALPGVLALGLHSVGMIGKFFADTIEHADARPIEAVKSSGASPLQVILHGILPQVLPQMADVTLYRWEYNFRASTVMGMVGAGGIGFELMSSLRLMQYQEVSAILIVILVMVTAVDEVGSILRRRFK